MRALDVEPWMHRKFWKHVRRGMPWECWNWIGGNARYGYLSHNRVLKYLAHRISFVMHNGSLGHFDQVNHECDNKRCVNPFHLYLGSPMQNNTDAFVRGQTRTGASVYCAKMNETQVSEARRRYKAGTASVRTLAKQHGVSYCTMRHALIGTRWRSATEPPAVNGYAPLTKRKGQKWFGVA